MPSNETQQALTERELELLHEEIAELRAEVKAMAAERDKALRWGIFALGSALIGLATFVFNLVTAHIQK
jgi:hypothetical protein